MKPLILIIMDGWGLRSSRRYNAVKLAKTPNYDFFLKAYPNTRLKAAQEAVGLPKGTIGNSEVGHLNLGAGRVVYQELTRINDSIKNRSFFRNKVLVNGIKKSRKLHIMGLLSDGGVHSHINHLFALLELCKEQNVFDVELHLFLDGRDVPAKSALSYIKKLNKKMEKLRIGRIATIIGRYYSMDRDKRWHRTRRAYDLLVRARGFKHRDAVKSVKYYYKKGITDEFMEPIVLNDYKGINDGDSVIFFNFRLDRARQITSAFVKKDFKEFTRKRVRVKFDAMCEYDKKIKTAVAFPPTAIKNNLGNVLSKNGLRQLRIAETEKYAHATFFFNSQVEKPNKGEDRIIIPSPKVSTYDQTPEMSAYEIKKDVINEIKKDKHRVIILNFANADMVGHTGDLKATIKAVEVVDDCVKQVVDEIIKKNGVALITADHGNAEEMKGKHATSHTLNDVPLILIGKKCRISKGALADVAPTILELIGVKKPREMTGKSLIVK